MSVRPTWVVCKWNLRLLARTPFFWFVVGLGLCHYLLCAVMLRIEVEWSIENRLLLQWLDDVQRVENGQSIRQFLNFQSTAVCLLLIQASRLLFTDDQRNGGLEFYLARVGRGDYVLGKMSALGLAAGLVTFVPASALFAQAWLLEPGNSWHKRVEVAIGITGYSLAIMSTSAVLLPVVGIPCKKATASAAAWLTIFLVLPAIANVCWRVYHDRTWLLLNLWLDLELIGQWCFGEPGFRAKEAIGMVLFPTRRSLPRVVRRLLLVSRSFGIIRAAPARIDLGKAGTTQRLPVNPGRPWSLPLRRPAGKVRRSRA